MIGGMAIQPVTITPVGATSDVQDSDTNVTDSVALSLSDSADENEAREKPAAVEELPVASPIALPIREAAVEKTTAEDFSKPIQQKKVVATVVGVDQRSGRVILRSGQPMRPGASVTVYHQYLTGEQLVAHLLIDSVNGNQAIAKVTDTAGLTKIHSGDRADCF